MGLALSDAQAQRMRAHLALLAKWNRKVNLTAVAREDMVARHLLDCLAIAAFVRGRRLLDLGSGAGFPGIPLAIIAPHLEVTLIESRAKRAEFLRHAVDELALANVETVQQRAEAYRPARKFDTLAARAFASLGACVEVCARLHRPGGRLLAMKAKLPTREIAELTPAQQQRMTIEKLRVPFLAAQRRLIIIEF
ncbi:MAG: 16S rRNA (guanine(527)-N(7))-methyltransferase RsmG [bacterium]